MELIIRIDLDNAAFGDEESGEFEPGPELARILRQLADSFEKKDDSVVGQDGSIRDINGNKVGLLTFT